MPKAKRANIVYGVKCGDKDCQERYVGETQQSLGARMNQYRRPSSNPAQTSAVYTRLNSTGHAFYSDGRGGLGQRRSLAQERS